MAEKRIRTKEIIIEQRQGTFNTLFKRFKSDVKPDIAILRTILNKEKARILHALKQKQPNSLYELAKVLGRDLKAVRQDTIILENFGIIEMIPIHKGKRIKLKPLLVIDELDVKIRF